MNNKIFAGIVLILVIGLAGFYYLYPVKIEVVKPVACIADAKICPDGSSVGRTGPACEFAECPKIQVQEATTTALNQKIFNNGIFITPLAVVADSRCPIDVTCIWAGEVSLQVLLERGTTSKNIVVKSQTAVIFEGYTVSLSKVAPENISTTTLKAGEYRFTFVVTPLATVALGTLSGRVTTSPTCPVEQVPAEPQCSPKPYATTIYIRESQNQAIVKTIQSDNLGAFTVDLPQGSYTVDAITLNNATLPRCIKESVVIKSAENTTQNISCDTGIR